MSWQARLEHRDSVDSTMQVARELAAAGAVEGTAVLARAQTQGRGRRGRSWRAARDAGVWMTVVLRPRREARLVSELALVAGLAVWRAARRLGATQARLKWPNDVLVGERKLAGILLEGEQLGTGAPLVLAGIGLNVAPAATIELPADVAERYVGLGELVAAPPIDDCARVVLEELEACYTDWSSRGLGAALAQWNEADALAGARVRVQAARGPVEGEARGLNERGELCVLTTNGLIAVRAGEVERVRPLPHAQIE